MTTKVGANVSVQASVAPHPLLDDALAGVVVQRAAVHGRGVPLVEQGVDRRGADDDLGARESAWLDLATLSAQLAPDA